MTSSQFQILRTTGMIARNARVRTVLFRFAGSSNKWAEVFIDGRYTTIEQQEEEFRGNFASACQFLTPRVTWGQQRDQTTVAAKDWVFV